MSDFDVFNGDADGLCSLLQLRLAEPRDAVLVTGIKRDIQLLSRVPAQAGDRVTVLDVSLDSNRSDLERVLEAGADVFYVDHHFAGDIPQSPQLRTHINTAADVCTALLVNGYLKGRFAEWAVVGAFGDNLDASADALLRTLSVDASQRERLRDLGIYLNYNGYGAKVEDLHFAPDALFRKLQPYDNPMAFLADAASGFTDLEIGYRDDMAKAEALNPVHATAAAAVYVLPNAPWARRVSGVFSNDLANLHPSRAHAVLTELEDSAYLVSVRAPKSNKQGADTLCRQFETGGGRAAAAGINRLPEPDLARFMAALEFAYSS
jgi:hypothetical protein